MTTLNRQHRIGLTLSGGGARGAYQAGVLKAIAEITRPLRRGNPFPIITGVSAGAINAAYLGAFAYDFSLATEELCQTWRSLTTEKVFRTDALSMSRIGLRMIADISIGNFATHKISKALLDTAPLRKLLEKIPFEQIQRNIDDGHIDAIAITALDYATSCNITFVQGRSDTPAWERLRRKSFQAQLSVDHIMGSSAIPLFFPPIAIQERFYGDGCLRNTAPLSPAVHLESDRLIIIGVRKESRNGDFLTPQPRPSVARILSVILNGVMMDAIDTDVERLAKVNDTMSRVQESESINYKRIDYCWIRPSEDLGRLAVQYTNRLPKMIRYLLGGLGSANESSELTSYLLFEPEYCGMLVDIGYRDGLSQKNEILEIFSTQPANAVAQA